MGPVRSTIPKVVAQVYVDIFGDEKFHNLSVAFAGGNVEAREADLVFDLGVASAIHELLECIDHIFLRCKMHRGVSTDILMVLDVRLSSVLEQDLYYGTVFGLHSVL